MESHQNKPGNSSFKQQKLRSFKFSISKRSLGIIYCLSGFFLILISIILITYSNSVIEHTIRYDNRSGCDSDWLHPGTCSIEFSLSDKMKNPVFLYYEITNFYQSHRKYVKSRDIYQLMGKTVTKSEAKRKCYPAVSIDQVGLIQNNPYLTKKSLARPCGLVARSHFNDTFEIFPQEGQNEVKISFKDISWDFDRHEKFKNHESHLMWTDIETGHFINWASPSGLSTSRKLWGKIENDLEKGKYYLLVHSNYDVSDFDGEKRVVLTTSSPFGGKSVFLGVFCIVVGVLSCFFGIGVFFMIFRRKRQRIAFE